ncbi:MAG: NADH-quinone oxidoreductase subunit J [Planifilum fimeticola]|jgi:NADH-quinone oxidoreductase subunit J
MNLSGEFFAFLIFSLMAIGGAVFMISFTRVVHMALAMAFTFLSLAGMYVLLNAEFVAVVQVLIYTGAVTILMLYGIMLTRHRDEDHAEGRRWHRLLSFVGVTAFGLILLLTIWRLPLPESEADPASYTVQRLGEIVFRHYVIPFELTSVLLLVALVGAVILAKREGQS